MAKLKKYSLEDLEKTFQCMNELEKAMLVGGGMDYVFDSMGRIKSMSTNDLDYSRALCGSGSSLVYNFKNELVISSYLVTYEDEEKRVVYGYSTRMEGGNIGLFDFLADNTDVEWSAQFNGGADATSSNPCIITTTNSKTRCLTYLEKETNDTFVHSHPDGSNRKPSENAQLSEKDWQMIAEGDFGHYALRANGETYFVK